METFQILCWKKSTSWFLVDHTPVEQGIQSSCRVGCVTRHMRSYQQTSIVLFCVSAQKVNYMLIKKKYNKSKIQVAAHWHDLFCEIVNSDGVTFILLFGLSK